jgi:hypothetical protein
MEWMHLLSLCSCEEQCGANTCPDPGREKKIEEHAKLDTFQLLYFEGKRMGDEWIKMSMETYRGIGNATLDHGEKALARKASEDSHFRDNLKS